MIVLVALILLHCSKFQMIGIVAVRVSTEVPNLVVLGGLL